MGRTALAHEAIEGAVLGLRDQGHDVVQEGPLGLDQPGDLFQVLVVDPRDEYRVDLDQDAARHQHFESLLLPLDEDLGGLAALDPAVFPEDPGINLGADIRVHAIDGEGDVVDVERAQVLDQVRQGEPIG